MSGGLRHPIVPPADLTRFLVAFGLVPLLFANTKASPPLSEGHTLSLPWSFALTPTWSMDQLAFIGLAGVVLGVTSGRPAQGLAAVTLGILLGLAADLWWLAGWVTPYEQRFVSMLPPTEWRSRSAESALVLLGVVAGAFLVGAVVRRLIRDRSRPSLRRPTGSQLVAVGLAVIGGPVLALGIAAAAASSALLVPDGAQVQTVRVSAGAITVDPAVLRPGPTRFRCLFALEAALGWAYLVPVPEGVDVEAASHTFAEAFEAASSQNFGVSDASCGPYPGTVTWGTPADLHPSRYIWLQDDAQSEVPRPIATSPVVIVAP